MSLSSVEEPVAAEPPAVEETVWKKEVSFGRKSSDEDPVVDAEPVIAEATCQVTTDEQAIRPRDGSRGDGLDEGSLVQPRAGGRAGRRAIARRGCPSRTKARRARSVCRRTKRPVAQRGACRGGRRTGRASCPPQNVEVDAAAEPGTRRRRCRLHRRRRSGRQRACADAVEVVQPPVAAADLRRSSAEEAPKVPFWKKELARRQEASDQAGQEAQAEGVV